MPQLLEHKNGRYAIIDYAVLGGILYNKELSKMMSITVQQLIDFGFILIEE